jgi:hypothetical protein
MKLQNKTIFHDNKIKEIINFTMPKTVKSTFEHYKKLSITFNVFTGNGYTGETNVLGFGKFLINLQVASFVNKFPYDENTVKPISSWRIGEQYLHLENRGTKDYLRTLVLSREEALVHTIAHELRHVWQELTEPPVWDELTNIQKEGLQSHPGISDKDADRYAIRKQREWRKLHAVDVYPEQPDTILQLPRLEIAAIIINRGLSK